MIMSVCFWFCYLHHLSGVQRASLAEVHSEHKEFEPLSVKADIYGGVNEDPSDRSS